MMEMTMVGWLQITHLEKASLVARKMENPTVLELQNLVIQHHLLIIKHDRPCQATTQEVHSGH